MVLVLTATQHKNQDTRTNKQGITNAGQGRRPPCPLCGSRLLPAQKLHSVAYPAGREKIMHIHGCPHCSPPNSGLSRRCPVCKKTIPGTGFAVGRMWERNGKLHLHITGCTVCKPRYNVKAE